MGAKHYDYTITTSCPQKLIDQDPNGAFFFFTKMKFDAADYTKFDPNENRLSPSVCDVIAKDVCSHYFGLNLVGVDIIIEEETQNIYLIDINYFSSYKGLPHLDVEKAFKSLIAEKHEENIVALSKAGVHLEHHLMIHHQDVEQDVYK